MNWVEHEFIFIVFIKQKSDLFKQLVIQQEIKLRNFINQLFFLYLNIIDLTVFIIEDLKYKTVFKKEYA